LTAVNQESGIMTEQDNKAIEEAIKKAEGMTSGEIVFATAPASAHYHHATLQGALVGMAVVTAVFLALPLSHTPTSLLWTEFISFAIFYAILPHLPCRRWFISKQEMDARVKDAAFMQFYSSGLYKTRESNGVEIYLSFFEREVVVIGDRAIHEKMGDQHWDNVRDLIIRGMRRGDVRGGICAAIDACGKALAEHFPHRPDDINELPDTVIDRSLGPQSP
jgi:putative membrane protein